MVKRNCWEMMRCGRDLGMTENAVGTCPATTETRTDGLHGGKNAGRVCWAISGTMCNGRIQGTFARKAGGCLRCDFFHTVRQEEGKRMLSVQEIRQQLPINCWEYKRCGREPGGNKTGELGVCPAASLPSTRGMHGGRNAGRVCWAISGTMCNGGIQGTFAQKAGGCLRCDFFIRVHQEEGANLLSVSEIRQRSGRQPPP